MGWSNEMITEDIMKEVCQDVLQQKEEAGSKFVYPIMYIWQRWHKAQDLYLISFFFLWTCIDYLSPLSPVSLCLIIWPAFEPHLSQTTDSEGLDVEIQILYRVLGLSGFPSCHALLQLQSVATSAPRGRHLAQRRRKQRGRQGNNKTRVCVSHCALHQSAGSKASTGLPPRPNHQTLASRWNKYIKLWGIIKMTDDWVSSEIQHY